MNGTLPHHKVVLALLLLLGASYASAAQRTEAGLTLLEPSGARAASLAESASSLSDDITALAYNPASLATLKTGQASFLYHRGAIEDSFGQLMFGMPVRERASLGLSVGYYDGGAAEVFDGVTQRQVTVQKDLLASLGGALKMGAINLGVAGKYFSSELGDVSSARSLAWDLGLGYAVSSRLKFGAALQNYGPDLKYEAASYDLPRTIRAGASYSFSLRSLPSLLSLEIPYSVTRRELEPALGFETSFGILALRAGFKNRRDGQEFSVGTGFMVGKLSFDYAFGLVDKLDSRHLLSLSMRFAPPSPRPVFVKKEPQPKEVKEAKVPIKIKPLITPNTVKYEPAPYPRFPIKPLAGNDPASRVYIVREGDTLKSIAKAKFGYEDFWQEIMNTNRHLGIELTNLKPGQRILLPKKVQ